MYRRILIFGLGIAAALMSHAQADRLAEIRENPGRAGGVYYAYPVTETVVTPAPDGYKPFYISHYGRHGSRYLISDKDYQVVIDRLNHAAEHNALTPLGLEIKARMDTVWAEAQGRGGELTPLGNRQHRAIATRMGEAYPEAFAPGAEVTASSTTVMRCAHSMFAFIEGLKQLYPYLEIPRESGQRDMYFLNYHDPETGWLSGHEGPWYQTWKRLRTDNSKSDRLMASIFSDPEYVKTWVDPEELMWQLYWVTVDMQNMESDVTFYDIFTPEELHDLWQVFNFNFFACNSSYAPAEGAFTANARNLVNDILVNAQKTIADGSHGAKLRFGHDGNVIPLIALLRFPGCYTDETDPYKLGESWVDYKICPMAGNVQFVFFRNDAGDVLVKVLHNEIETSLPITTDSYPFYHWADVEAYLSGIVNGTINAK